jgi:hypothetical protein
MSILGSEIDDLKGVFSKRQGAAQTNRFMIFMQPPSASLFNLDVNAAITGAISGDINLGGFINDPRDVSLLCESCTLPGRSITTIEKQNVKQAVKVPYSFLNEDVTFTFILTGDYYMRKMFDNWSNLVFDTNKYEMRYPESYTTDVRIAQLNKQNVPVYTVKLEKAYPTTINAITLDNTAENSIQKVTVNMTYENFVVEGFVDAVSGIAKEALGPIRRLF